jgi:surface protein
MAIIHSYREGEPESGDKLIVTDAAGRETKSVSVDSLVSFVNDTNQVAAPIYTPITDELIAEGIVADYYNDKEAPKFASATNTPYYGPIENWDVSQVTNMDSLFDSKTIEFDLSLWNTGNVTSMISMFSNATFASDFMLGLATWDMSNVTSTSGMFTSSNFNGDISDWDTSKVTSMANMFYDASDFNQDINSWDVSDVTTMDSMFNAAHAFNRDLNSWDVYRVISTQQMFSGATLFNGNISSWDTSKVTSMFGMFEGASSFNKSINNWDVSKVVSMRSMFEGAESFNQDLSSLGVSSVTDMNYMFNGATAFNQDISSWNVPKITERPTSFTASSPNTSMEPEWGVNKLEGTSIRAEGVEIANIVNDKDLVTKEFMEGAIDIAVNPPVLYTPLTNATLVTAVSSYNTGNLLPEFYDPNNVPYYGLMEDWDVSQVTDMSNLFSNRVVEGIDIGNWDVSNVTDMFRMFADSDGTPVISSWDVSNVVSMMMMFKDSTFAGDLSTWDVGNVLNMAFMFEGCQDLENLDIGNWDTSNVKMMLSMFQGSNFSNYIGSWEVGNVTNMSNMFKDNYDFSEYLTDWDVSSVTTMSGMFLNGSFDGNISGWDVSSVTNMAEMFSSNHFFTGDISEWDVSNVENMDKMFFDTQSFLGIDLSGWDVADIPSEPTDFKTLSVFTLPAYQPRWGFDKYKAGESGYSHTGAFADKPISNQYVWQAGGGISYTQADVSANSYKVFSLSRAVHEAVDNPYWSSPAPTGQTGIGLFQGAYLPDGASTLVDYDYSYDAQYPTSSGTGFEGSTGRIKLNDIRVGDRLQVRFDFNVIPQVANTTIEPALWYSNRNANDDITFTFPLTAQPIFFGTGTVANTYLNRVEISAWIASDEDINALTLPAIKSDNPVIIQPLGLLITIIR